MAGPEHHAEVADYYGFDGTALATVTEVPGTDGVAWRERGGTVHLVTDDGFRLLAPIRPHLVPGAEVSLPEHLGLMCDATSPAGRCRRVKDHPGPHATEEHGRVVATWTDPGTVLTEEDFPGPDDSVDTITAMASLYFMEIARGRRGPAWAAETMVAEVARRARRVAEAAGHPDPAKVGERAAAEFAARLDTGEMPGTDPGGDRIDDAAQEVVRRALRAATAEREEREGKARA